jgi:hypothetical protein
MEWLSAHCTTFKDNEQRGNKRVFLVYVLLEVVEPEILQTK